MSDAGRMDVVVCTANGAQDILSAVSQLLTGLYDVKAVDEFALAAQPWNTRCALLVVACCCAATLRIAAHIASGGRVLFLGPQSATAAMHTARDATLVRASDSETHPILENGRATWTLNNRTVMAYEPDSARLQLAVSELGIAVPLGAAQSATPIYAIPPLDLDAAIAAASGVSLDWSMAVMTAEQWSFDPQVYLSAVGRTTDDIGRAILYAEITDSTQTFLQTRPDICRVLPHGTVFVAGHQMRGRGRGSNAWLSSTGCLQHTMLLHIPTHFPATLLQHLSAIAMVAFLSTLDLRTVSVRIKWPNDIYVLRSSTPDGSDAQSTALGDDLLNNQIVQELKIGGILTTLVGEECVLVGVGLNLTGTPWAHALADIAKRPLRKEDVLAGYVRSFAERLRRAISMSTKQNPAAGFPFDEYYRHWMHSAGRHSAVRTSEAGQPLAIVGIDARGYMLARDSQGKEFALEPDGNSFDLTSNLVAPKRP